VKEATKKGAKLKKRSLNVDELEKPKKRPCMYASYSRFAMNSNDLIDPSDTVAVRISDYTISTTYVLGVIHDYPHVFCRKIYNR
jgi:hypothetical protein